jgi:recombination protein RecR
LTGPASSIERAVHELSRLPGVGRKTAQRLALHLLKVRPEEVTALAEALVDMRRRVRECERCFHLSEEPLCEVCRDPRRDPGLLCVVEEPADVLAFERTGAWAGFYHVLGGALSPLRDLGPDDLHVAPLLERVRRESPREVVLATNANVEGEATAVYLARLLREMEVPVTRLAQGLPAGGDLEWVDELTLRRAFEGRRDY